MKMLIADPDQEFVNIVTYWLRSRGHQSSIARNAHEALERWRAEKPDLAIIDLTLPGADGADFCLQLRQTGTGLILVLTDPTHEDEEVRALEQGADEYLQKPISMRHLQARISALARRGRAMAGAAGSAVVVIGGASVNLTHYEVIRNGRHTRLTPTEGRLLQFLLSNAGHVVSASSIIEHIWGYEGTESRLIKTHIHHLRQKIEPDPDHPRFLLTFPTAGYLLRLQEAEPEDAPSTNEDAGVRGASSGFRSHQQLFSVGA
ncbi:MAG TPA: response regulator transcription factor [Ktedonobacterales bacterium]